MNIDLSKFDRFKVAFQKGDQIFCEYEPGDSFYLIQSGRVQIVKIMGDIEKIVDILHPGEIFGEMAILEEAPRSASAIAIDHVEVLEFNKKNFEIHLRGNPQIAMKLLQTFIKRIYDAADYSDFSATRFIKRDDSFSIQRYSGSGDKK